MMGDENVYIQGFEVAFVTQTDVAFIEYLILHGLELRWLKREIFARDEVV